MRDSTTSTVAAGSGGVSFLEALGIAFIVLKLTGVIAWPWIWVLAPIWIPAAVVFCLLFVFLLVFVIAKTG